MKRQLAILLAAPLRDSVPFGHFTPPSLYHFMPQYIATGSADDGLEYREPMSNKI